MLLTLNDCIEGSSSSSCSAVVVDGGREGAQEQLNREDAEME